MEEAGEPCGDDYCLCVYNASALAFWSFFVLLFEFLLLVLSLPVSTFETIIHFVQISLLSIGLFGLYGGCCHHHLVRFHAFCTWPLTVIALLSLPRYSNQLTSMEWRMPCHIISQMLTWS